MISPLPIFPPSSIFPQVVIVRKAETPPPQPILYTVKDGDNLTTIATGENTTIQRLYDKNTAVVNPDQINPGDVLTVPATSEVLTDRPMPVSIVSGATTPKVQSPPSGGFSSSTGNSGSSGNSYAAGNCTWYVKNMRPELPNNLGNADTWFSQAAAQGLAVGYTPKVGAVAVAISYMHVALVTAVHGDSITVSEMNYKGFGVISSRSAPISEFRYIY